MIASTASAASTIIAPYPMRTASRSRASCFTVVPLAMRLWKPEIAPQATITNSMGQSGPDEPEKPPTAGAWKAGRVRRRPR